MPTPGTKRKAIRVDAELWDLFGESAIPDRSAVLRDFMRWYCRQPGAKLPQRPAAT